MGRRIIRNSKEYVIIKNKDVKVILQVGKQGTNGKVCLARTHEEHMSFPGESLQHHLLFAVYTH